MVSSLGSKAPSYFIRRVKTPSKIANFYRPIPDYGVPPMRDLYFPQRQDIIWLAAKKSADKKRAAVVISNAGYCAYTGQVICCPVVRQPNAQLLADKMIVPLSASSGIRGCADPLRPFTIKVADTHTWYVAQLGDDAFAQILRLIHCIIA
jgi:hypothetical protein